MAVQEIYVRTLVRICTALASFSDPVVAAAFGRLGRTVDLIGARLYGSDQLTIDRHGSGLPVLSEVVSLRAEAREGVYSEDSPDEVRRRILDFMMTRRRRPPPDLVRRMARAVYATALRTSPDLFGTEPATIGLAGAHDLARFAAWDFWDGVAMTPIHVRCAFESIGECDDHRVDAVATEVARLFSPCAFDAMTLARELDDRIPPLRLKALTKIALGPFRSDVFTQGTGDGSLVALLSQIDDVSESWAMGWTTEALRSTGTMRRRDGFLGLTSRPIEEFVADGSEAHLLVPHAVYQLLADAPEGRAILDAHRVHVIDGASLTQDV
jgi:hypothetical protein